MNSCFTIDGGATINKQINKQEDKQKWNKQSMNDDARHTAVCLSSGFDASQRFAQNSAKCWGEILHACLLWLLWLLRELPDTSSRASSTFLYLPVVVFCMRDRDTQQLRSKPAETIQVQLIILFHLFYGRFDGSMYKWLVNQDWVFILNKFAKKSLQQLSTQRRQSSWMSEP